MCVGWNVALPGRTRGDDGEAAAAPSRPSAAASPSAAARSGEPACRSLTTVTPHTVGTQQSPKDWVTALNGAPRALLHVFCSENQGRQR